MSSKVTILIIKSCNFLDRPKEDDAPKVHDFYIYYTSNIYFLDSSHCEEMLYLPEWCSALFKISLYIRARKKRDNFEMATSL